MGITDTEEQSPPAMENHERSTGSTVIEEPGPMEKRNGRSKNKALVAMIIAVVALLAIVLPLLLTSGKDSEQDAKEAVDPDFIPVPTPGPLHGTMVPTVAPTAFFYETDTLAIQNLMQDYADKEFYMFNVIQYREQAVYEDGRETTLTGFEANAVYSAYVSETALPSIGARVIFSTDIQSDFGNETRWENVGIVQYPNATAFSTMVQDPKFQEMLAHKTAGVFDTILLACERQEDTLSMPGPETPPWPPNATNLPTAMVNVVEYSEFAHYDEGAVDADNSLTGREAFAKYTDVAGPIVFVNGVRPIGYFDVKATLVGNESWEEIRINLFPSEENFYYTINDPTRKSATYHRQAGVEDSTHAFKGGAIRINQLVDWWDDLNPLST